MEKIKIVILLLLSVLSSHVQADEQLYKIELLIFSQDMLSTEVFDQIESQIAWPRHTVKRSAYKRVDSKNMSLYASYAKLARSNNYQPLKHVAWIQGIKENRLGTAVQISNADRSINGFFRIQRGNLLHMIADIEYSPGSYMDSVIYRLKEKRRFKLNEIHYLDHPKFGMLVRISLLSE
ncbi:MAG: peptidoglycan binding protein CsiV [Methylococcaceae bacterium]|nr:peptidoglycan binding protein CsiV [Methylococcaceae bacterium]